MIKRIKLKTLDSVELFRTDLSQHTFPTHYHETFCISLIEGGTFCENELIAPTDTILISHPFEVHENSLYKGSVYSHTSIYVSPDVIKFMSNSETVSFDDRVIYDENLFRELKALAKKTFSNNQTLSFEKSFSESITKLVGKYAVTKSFTVSEKDSLIEEAKRFILDNLDTKISLEDLAGKFGMNKFKFIRWFKQNVGLTPFDFILLNRIESGKEMINQGKPLLETAIDTGFYDQSHFSNYFKRFVGVTPKTYQSGCNIFQDN